MTADIVEYEVKRSLEWLDKDRSEQRRHAAVLILRELARNTPTMFNLYVERFINQIWVTIWDARLNIREASALALRACLELIRRRDAKWSAQWYSAVLSKIQQVRFAVLYAAICFRV